MGWKDITRNLELLARSQANLLLDLGLEDASPLGSGGRGTTLRVRQGQQDLVYKLSICAENFLDRTVDVQRLSGVRYRSEGPFGTLTIDGEDFPLRTAEDRRDLRLALTEVAALRAVKNLNGSQPSGGNNLQGWYNCFGALCLGFAYRYIPGSTLYAHIHQDSLTPHNIGLVFRDVTVALSRYHEYGILHRDVKPENIIVREGERVSGDFIDFGLAQFIDGSAAKGTVTTGSIMDKTMDDPRALMGTPEYMPPEFIVDGMVSSVYDLFGLGVTFYQAVARETLSAQALKERGIDARKPQEHIHFLACFDLREWRIARERLLRLGRGFYESDLLNAAMYLLYPDPAKRTDAPFLITLDDLLGKN